MTAGVGVQPTLRDHLHDTLALVAGLVGLLLVLTVANLVNLVVSHVIRRHREVVIRKVLGDSWSNVTAALAAEGVALAIAGYIAAVLVGFGLIVVIDGATLMESMPTSPGVPLDGRGLGFALATALVVTGTTSLLAATGIQCVAPCDSTPDDDQTLPAGQIDRRQQDVLHDPDS